MTTSEANIYSPEQIEEIKADFFRDGYRLIRGVLTPDEIEKLKAAADRIWTDDRFAANRDGDYSAVRLFETDEIFEEMLTREPIISMVENILGNDCHLVADGFVRNAPGQAIDNFHVDDLVILPVADGMERHDARLRMPVFVLTVQILLTDVPELKYGPTEFVPGSHYSGRKPNDLATPTFEGRGAVPMLCKAGDLYLHNGQCWHRGAPNTSDRTRYLYQLAYGKRFIAQRFYPFVNYQWPQEVLDRADDRRKRVLGVHPKGAYG